MPIRTFVSAAVTAAALPLAAQQVWNVSPPGTNLINAMAAAQPGDVIVAAAGFYNVLQGIVTSKGVTVLGSPGTVLGGAGGGPVLTVRNLPAGQRFVLAGAELRMTGYFGRAFLFDRNLGNVHFARCTFVNANTEFSSPDEFEIQHCPNVSLTDCTTQRLTIYVLTSNVQLARCRLVGHGALDLFTGYGRAAQAGLVVYDAASNVTFSQCSAAGGDGHGQFPGAPAISTVDGTLTIAGDARDTYRAGVRGATSTASSAISLNSASLLIAGTVSVVPNAGAPPIQGGHAFTPRPVSVATQLGTGGAATTTSLGDGGDSVVVFAGVPGTRWSAGSLGSAWVLPDPLLVLGNGVFDANGQWSVSFQIPQATVPRGTPITLQAMTVGTTAPLRLSVPGTLVTN